MAQERRRKERYPSKLFADLHLPKKDTAGRAVVVNISLGGIAIDTECDLNLGDEVECFMEIPLRVKAKVVPRISWGQIKRYGLQMNRQNLLDRLILRRILKGKLQTRKI